MSTPPSDTEPHLKLLVKVRIPGERKALANFRFYAESRSAALKAVSDGMIAMGQALYPEYALSLLARKDQSDAAYRDMTADEG